MPNGKHRSILWLSLHAFFLQSSVATARPASSYLAIELGADTFFLGMVVATFSILPIFLALPCGRLIDKGKTNSVLIIGSVLVLFSAVGLKWWVPSKELLLLWNALMGVGLLASLLGEHKFVAHVAGPKQDRAFGYYTTAAAVAHMAGPLALGILGGHGVIPDTNSVLLFVIITSMALIGTTFPILSKRKPVCVKKRTQWKEAFDVQKLIRIGMGVNIALSTLTLTAIDLLQVYLPAMAVERELSVQAVSLTLTIRACGTAIARFGLSYLVEIYGRTKVLLMSAGCAGIFMILLVLPSPLWVLYIVSLILGIMLGVGQPISMATIALYAPRAHQGTWFAMRLTGSRIGQVGLPLILSLALGGIGSAGVLAGSGALLLIASGVSRKPLRNMEIM